ncbi:MULTISPECIES: hypothetical protein [Pirellulaceae]|uniref:hypothetical protein n=1 Tax=Pirellulaceae TaxID=2691357 RepID=UPI0018EDF0AB|nr:MULTISPECIES: hypothetical protein [Pirellulaceae]
MSDFHGPSLEDLQGEWICVNFGDDGHKVPFYVPWFRKPRVVFEGYCYRTLEGDTCLESGRFDIRRGVEYSLLDQLIEMGEHYGREHHGIIRWVGDKLEHLQGHVGYPRPAGFPYGRGFKCHYALLSRAPSVKPEHPLPSPKTWKG